MKIFITTQGDSSVGIYPATATVNLPFDVTDDTEREDIRKRLTETFAEIMDDKVKVEFEDECADCGSLLKDNKCYNGNCISNET